MRQRKRIEEMVVEEEEQEESTQAREEEIDAIKRIIRSYKDRIKNPLTAIRSHCVECMGGQVGEVARCTSLECSLYPMRMGKNTMHSRYGKPQPHNNLRQQKKV